MPATERWSRERGADRAFAAAARRTPPRRVRAVSVSFGARRGAIGSWRDVCRVSPGSRSRTCRPRAAPPSGCTSRPTRITIASRAPFCGHGATATRCSSWESPDSRPKYGPLSTSSKRPSWNPTVHRTASSHVMSSRHGPARRAIPGYSGRPNRRRGSVSNGAPTSSGRPRSTVWRPVRGRW